MRRVRYHEYGGPEVLRIEEAEVPEPGEGQVLVKVEVIGANFVDTLFRRGAGDIFRRSVPAELTGDVVGTVEALGPGVAECAPDVEKGERSIGGPVAVGDRVAGLTDSAFAEYVVLDADWLIPVPGSMSMAAASMLPDAAGVAAGTLLAGRIEPGDTVLVHAAAGNIGHLAVQLAGLLGAGTVIGTAGGADKLEFVRAQGAVAAVDYRAGADGEGVDWTERVRALAPDGVDLILDSVGGRTFHDGLELLAPHGRMVTYGAASGDLPNVPVSSLYGLKSVAGFSLLAWRAARPEEARGRLAQMADHLAAGRLRVAVHGTYALDEVVRVHELLDAREQMGRVLVVP